MDDSKTASIIKMNTIMLSGTKGSGRSTKVIEIAIGYQIRNKHSPVFIVQYKKSTMGIFCEEIYNSLNDDIRYNIMIINSEHLEKLTINLEKKLLTIPRLQIHEDSEGNYIIKEYFANKI